MPGLVLKEGCHTAARRAQIPEVAYFPASGWDECLRVLSFIRVQALKFRFDGFGV